MEYTVGIKDIIAGNIDMLCWNDYAKEIQIWDYKNTKEIAREGFKGQKCLSPFTNYADCNYVHYSIQLNMYKQEWYEYTLKINKLFNGGSQDG